MWGMFGVWDDVEIGGKEGTYAWAENIPWCQPGVLPPTVTQKKTNTSPLIMTTPCRGYAFIQARQRGKGNVHNARAPIAPFRGPFVRTSKEVRQMQACLIRWCRAVGKKDTAKVPAENNVFRRRRKKVGYDETGNNINTRVHFLSWPCVCGSKQLFQSGNNASDHRTIARTSWTSADWSPSKSGGRYQSTMGSSSWNNGISSVQFTTCAIPRVRSNCLFWAARWPPTSGQ